VAKLVMISADSRAGVKPSDDAARLDPQYRDGAVGLLMDEEQRRVAELRIAAE
jgi:hypothetical protein